MEFFWLLLNSQGSNVTLYMFRYIYQLKVYSSKSYCHLSLPCRVGSDKVMINFDNYTYNLIVLVIK